MILNNKYLVRQLILNSKTKNQIIRIANIKSGNFLLFLKEKYENES